MSEDAAHPGGDDQAGPSQVGADGDGVDPTGQAQAGPGERLFTYDFTVLALAAAFGFGTIAVFYGLAAHLERLGVDPSWRGAVIAAEPMAALLSRPALGVLLTPGRALTAARASLVGLGAALPLYLLARDVPALLAVRALHGLFFVCLVSAVTVLLAKVVRPSQAGRAFGCFSLATLLPFAAMPPLVERLLPLAGDEAVLYAWTAVLVLPALALTAPLGARLGRGAFPPGREHAPTLAEMRANLASPAVLLILGANLLVFTCTTQVFFFVKQFAAWRGFADPGLFFTVSTGATIAARLAGARAFDRLPGRALATASLAALGVCIAAFPLAGGQGAFLALAGCYGLLVGLGAPLLNAAMFLESEPRFRPLNLNLMLFMMDAGYVLGPLAGGLLAAGPGGYTALFAASAACAAGAAGMLAPLAVRERKRRPD